jgi:signal transduction histidine kinase
LSNTIKYIIFFIASLHICKANTTIISAKTNSIKINTDNTNKQISKNKIKSTFTLKNIEHKDLSIVLELPSEKIEQLIVTYTNQQYKIIDTFNYNINIKHRKYYDRDIIFEYELLANSVANFDLEIYFNKNIREFDIYVWNKIAKINSTQILEMSKGVFYGILFLFLIICFILYRLMKDKNYIWFFIYLLLGTIYLLIKQNIAYEFFLSNYPEIDNFLKKIILVTYIVVALNFLRLFILKRIPDFILNKYIKIYLHIGITTIIISLSIGFFSNFVKYIFSIFQYVYIVFSVIIFIASFIISYLKFTEKSLFYFILSFILSFSFFLFYPVPTTSKYISEINFKLVFTYSNAFILALVISITILWRVMQIIKSNKKMRLEVSNLHAQNNFAVITAQMNERKRVGKELHDGIGILMATTKMKVSSIKTKDVQEAETLQQIIHKIDTTTQKIRKFSHNLLPPTLLKFGIHTALNDEIEHFNLNHNNQITYTTNISDNLDEASNYILYDIIISLIKYFYNSNNYNIFISINTKHELNLIAISIKYSGNKINNKDKNINNIYTIIELLHGNIHHELINTFTHQLQLEIPIRMK